MLRIIYIIILFLVSSSAYSNDDNWNFAYKTAANNIPALKTDTEIPTLKKVAKINISAFYDINQIVPNIVVEDNIAYTLDRDNKIVFIDLQKNKVMKKVKLKGYSNSRPAGLAVFNSYIYIGFDDGRLLAFSLLANSIVWETQLSTPITSVPMVDENKIYVISQNDIYAINNQNGEILWNVPGNKNAVSLKVLQSVSIINNYLMVGLSTSDFLVIQKENGNIIWKYNLKGYSPFNIGPDPLNGDIKAPILAYKGNVIVSSNNKIKYLNYNNKDMLWQNNDYGSSTLPLIYKNEVLLVTGNNLLGLSLNEGTIVNQATLVTKKVFKEKLFWHYPILINDNYFLIANNIGEVALVSYKNNKLNQENTFALNNSRIEKTSTPPIVYNGEIITLSSKGYLYIYKVS